MKPAASSVTLIRTPLQICYYQGEDHHLSIIAIGDDRAGKMPNLLQLMPAPVLQSVGADDSLLSALCTLPLEPWTCR